MKIVHGGDVFGLARTHGWRWRDILDFSASINPLGPSRRVQPAIVAALDRIACYPEPEPLALRADLARLWDVDPEQILLGNGATDLLHFFARTTAQEQVFLAVPTFSEFHRAYPNATLVSWADAATWPNGGLLVLTQPNSPTGECMRFEELAVLSAARTGPILVDESFIDFTAVRSTVKLTRTSDKFFVLRSLTKFYGLPGLRIGALVGSSAAIGALRERREPWQVSVPAEVGARAAIADLEHAAATCSLVNAERLRVAARLSAECGVIVSNARANYLLAWCGFPAARLRDALLEQKILIRVCTGDPGIEGEAFRIAIRKPPENDRLLEAMRTAIRGL